jgi:hypothetical protein
MIGKMSTTCLQNVYDFCPIYVRKKKAKRRQKGRQYLQSKNGAGYRFSEMLCRKGVGKMTAKSRDKVGMKAVVKITLSKSENHTPQRIAGKLKF